MLIEITLVFDTEDGEYDGDAVTMDEIEAYAEELNLETARSMAGYQGWRVVTTGIGGLT